MPRRLRCNFPRGSYLWAVRAMRSDALAPRLKEMGLTVTGSTPEEFDEHMRKSLKTFAEIVKAAKVSIN